MGKLPWWGQLTVWVVGALAALWLAFTVLGGIGFKFDPFNLGEKNLENAQIDAALSKGDAAQSRAQGGLIQDAGAIAVKGRAREIRTGEIHATNSEAIERAKGASTPLSPELITSINRGLCNYESTPGCPSSKVRSSDPE